MDQKPILIGLNLSGSDFFWKFYNLDVFPLFAAYLILVATVPSLWKRYTNPLQLKSVLICYNALCSMLNLVSCVGMIYGVMMSDKLYSNTETPVLTPFYRLYGYLKVLELMDTVFMILRHRTRQITFLHVFHHSTWLLLNHYAVRYTPYTSFAPTLLLNAFVHVVMHFYYGYTVYLGSAGRPTWKKRITELQLLQFFLDLVYCLYGIYIRIVCIWSLFYLISMIVLFSQFYLRAYVYSSSKVQHSNGATSNTASSSNDAARKNQ